MKPQYTFFNEDDLQILFCIPSMIFQGTGSIFDLLQGCCYNLHLKRHIGAMEQHNSFEINNLDVVH